MFQRKANLIWLVLYLITMAGICLGLSRYKDWTTATFDNQTAHSEWQSWRDAVQEEKATEGSVRRRTPKSAEPPALVLMRDYFATCLVISLVLSSALFVTLMVAIRGVLSSGDGLNAADKP